VVGVIPTVVVLIDTQSAVRARNQHNAIAPLGVEHGGARREDGLIVGMGVNAEQRPLIDTH
jgi:hypothetical protein